MSGPTALFNSNELHQRFVDAKPKVIFCDDMSLPTVQQASKDCPGVKKIVVLPSTTDAKSTVTDEAVPFKDILQRRSSAKLSKVEIDPERDLVILPYSSGTTGRPKGVMLSHRNFGTMLNMVNSHMDERIFRQMDPEWDWTKESACLLLPFYHIYGIGMLMNTIRSGGCGVVLRKFTPETRHAFLVPSVLVLLAKSPLVDNYDLSSLKFIFTGGATAGTELIEEVQRWLPSVAQIAQGYGMTEVSMASHFPVFNEHNYASVGKLLPNLEMEIRDIETKQPLPRDSRGQICIRGPTITLGYLNNPRATEELVDEEGWLRTGDVGYADEKGFLYIVDRIKELIKVRGFQVAPAELEDLLLSNPDVRDCAVIGIADDECGEVPRAFVVRANENVTADAVTNFVKERVSEYKQLHGGVEFVEEVPKSPSGKILRRVLRERACQTTMSNSDFTP